MSAMGRLQIALLAVIAGLLGSAAFAASPPAAADPPPPASLENHDVEAWADAYLHTQGWTLLTHNLEGAHLTSHRGALTAARDGLIELEIRTELFHPVTIGAGPARSGVARWSVDCARKRLAILSMTAYAHNNMQGELGKKTIGVRAWREPNEGESATFGVICSAAKTGKGFIPKSLAPLSPA
jgi:surface-adhesin protein E